jgi:hypothetical protein
MRFWLFASLLGIVSAPCFAQLRPSRYGIKDNWSPRPFRSYELTLASLRPGKSKISRAISLNKSLGSPSEDNGTTVWFDRSACEKINFDADTHGLIESIRVSVHVFNGQKACASVSSDAGWKTGKGLSLRLPCLEATRIYGEPTSRSPSTKNGQPLELLYYAFDWAGPDVPQVMEVVCTAPKDGSRGQVVEITLAASSL